MPVVTFTGTRELPHEWEPRIHDLVGALPIGAVAVVGVCLGFDALVARLAHPRGGGVHAVVPADRSPGAPAWRRARPATRATCATSPWTWPKPSIAGTTGTP